MMGAKQISTEPLLKRVEKLVMSDMTGDMPTREAMFAWALSYSSTAMDFPDNSSTVSSS